MVLEREVPVSTSPLEKSVKQPVIKQHPLRTVTPKMKVHSVKEPPPLIELRSLFA
jgi:hypothetical protein